jgi:hypothetical protein
MYAAIAVRIIHLTAVMVLWTVVVDFAAAGEPTALPEHQIKTLFLFNFTKYVDWPGGSFAGTNDCYTIGIAGSDDIYRDLLELTKTKTVNGRKIAIKRIDQAEDARKCHIVYLGRSSEKQSATILTLVKLAPVLTVGEHENFLAQGGMVHFVREENKLKLEINLDVSQEAHLTISARLLQIAKVIRKHLTSGN